MTNSSSPSLALADESLSLLVTAFHGGRGDALQVLRRQLLEERDATQREHRRDVALVRPVSGTSVLRSCRSGGPGRAIHGSSSSRSRRSTAASFRFAGPRVRIEQTDDGAAQLPVADRIERLDR